MVQLPHQHGKNPSYVLEDMPKDGDFSAVSEIFHSVSDPKRLKLFWLLCHYRGSSKAVASVRKCIIRRQTERLPVFFTI